MANWNTLKESIANIIKANDNQEITGQLLQQTLINIISTVGENATFIDVATPSTNPGTLSGPIFYIASTPGIYSNFNGIKVFEQDGTVILKYSDGDWSKIKIGLPNFTKVKVLNVEISQQSNYYTDLENFIIDIKLTGDILGTEDDPHYWAPISVHIGGTEKQRVLLYRVDAEGNYLTGSGTDSITINLLGSGLSYVLNQDVKDKDGLTGKVSMVVDWTLWKHGKQEAMKPLRLNDDVLKDHFGFISILENVEITTDNVKAGYIKNVDSSNIDSWNNGVITEYHGKNGFTFQNMQQNGSGGIRTTTFNPNPNYHCIIDIEIQSISSGVVTVYLFGANEDKQLQAQQLQVGKNSFEFDPAYHAVYNNQTNFYLIVAVSTYESTVNVKNFICAQYPIGQAENLTETISDLQKEIAVLEGRVNTLESSDRIILTAPNGQKYIIQCNNTGSLFTVPLYAEVVSYVGNSLLLGNGDFGMNATEKTKDYAAIIGETIQEKGTGSYLAVKISGTTFEDATTQQEVNAWIEDVLTVDLDENSELVLIQLGDNINTPEKRSNFENTCSTLLSKIRKYCSKARVAWVYGWYVNDQVRSIIQENCKLYGVDYIEINDLNTPENQSAIGTVIISESLKTQTINYDVLEIISENELKITFTINGKQYTSELIVGSYDNNPDDKVVEFSGYQTITVSGGVASHPGDLGFQKIAQRIIERLKM